MGLHLSIPQDFSTVKFYYYFIVPFQAQIQILQHIYNIPSSGFNTFKPGMPEKSTVFLVINSAF